MKKTNSEVLIKEIKESTNLPTHEIETFYNLFNQYDKKQSGHINKSQIDEFFRELGYFKRSQVQKWLHEELSMGGFKYIELKQLCQLVVQVRQYIEELEEEEDVTEEYLDAFVAMGGNGDRSGYISRETLTSVMDEFGLTFDIEEFLEESGTQNQIDFETFCLIFQQGGEDAKSVITVREIIKINIGQAFSEKARRGSEQQFNVKMKDFERWEQQMLMKT